MKVNVRIKNGLQGKIELGKGASVRFAWIFFLFFAHSGVASAQMVIETNELDHFWGFLADLNSTSPLEGAGSHGSWGINLGVGFKQTSLPNAAYLPTENIYANRTHSSNVTMPGVALIKGLSWPIDVGMHASYLADSRIQQWGGFAQWTVFEELGLPALAGRVSHQRLFGLAHTDFASTGLHITISQGIMGWITVYGTLSQLMHTGTTRVPEPERGIYFSLNGSIQEETKMKWQESEYAVGAKVMFLPPFFATTFEWQRQASRTKAFLAKISVGI